jgi:hypothetical protein
LFGTLSDLEDPFGPARPDTSDRARRLASALAAPLRALVIPDRGVPPLVTAGRFWLPMAIVVVAGLLAAGAVSLRVDPGPAVRAASSGAPGPAAQPAAGGSGAQAPPEEVKTDREIEEEIAKQTAIIRVKLALSAALGTPLQILLLALALFVLGRYVGGKPSARLALAAAAVGALPWAVRSIIAAAAALRQTAIAPSDVDGLVAGGLSSALGNPLLARLVGSADLFSLWSVVLCGFGLSAAAGISRVRGLVAVAIGFVLLLMCCSVGAR